MMSTEAHKLLHITHARQDDAWVRGVLIPALGLTEDQYWTNPEDDLAALKLEELERAVQACCAARRQNRQGTRGRRVHASHSSW